MLASVDVGVPGNSNVLQKALLYWEECFAHASLMKNMNRPPCNPSWHQELAELTHIMAAKCKFRECCLVHVAIYLVPLKHTLLLIPLAVQVLGWLSHERTLLLNPTAVQALVSNTHCC
jgi:hypothetical protein